MLNKLSSKFKKKKPDVSIHQLISNVNQIAESHSSICFCPSTTGYSWMGVNRATKALFPENTIELLQYYSQTVYTEQEISSLCKAISLTSIEQVILSGFPPYFESIAKYIAKYKIKVKVIYHGFFAELSGNEEQQKILKQLIQLSQEGIISKVAFNKKGMAESIFSLWGINTCKIIIPTPIIKMPKVLLPDSFVRIGILGNDQYRKNLHNQIVAASLISNAELHITANLNLNYLPKNIKIVTHSSGIPHADFLQILGGMDINLHLSYSESWGQLTTESLSMGVPCLTSYHSDVFDYSTILKNSLIVDDYDNSWAIKEKIEHVLTKKIELSAMCESYIHQLNKESELTILSFLND